ncbi:MAG: hypothetical protein B7C24_07180 [Bacteroidetes bacterium 4572_77]|nr:MAG: hypothetical protein B7C24_07180 [Bacteroidetes bacterium 4572_77]
MAGVESVSLFYTISGQSEQVIPMSYIDGIYTAELPDQLAGASASYYIYATDYSENSISSEIFNILWYQGGWYGHVEGQNTGNNFGSVEDFTMGLVLELGEFEGKINKLAYMIPEYFNPPFSWKIVDVNINGNEVEWTDDVLVPEQTVTDELLYNASNWTEIEVETQANLTGTVGLVLELQAYSYWGRDANSTSGISWFVDDNTGQWAQLGVGYWIDFPGDWTLKAHLYDEDNVGFEKIVGNMGINIYPNPASDYVIIDFQLITDQDINMELFDIKGQSIRKIASSHLKEGNYNLQINTSDLSNGVYFIKSTMGKTLSTKQFVVNK